MDQTIYDFVKTQINSYQKPITMEDGWDWSMKAHLRRSFLYLNAQFEEKNEDRKLRPNKNIILAIINVALRTEGFDVKDIELYADNPDKYYKSLIIKKFHEKWARENAIDTLIDDIVYSYCVYGGVLVRNAGGKKPEVVNLRNLAFCNQRNILSYPFAIKHVLSAAELRSNKKWGQSGYGATMDVESLITLCEKEEKDEIEIYEVHGLMPKEWLKQDENAYIDEDSQDINQIQVIAYYQDQNKNQQGVTLFRSKEPVLPFKFLARDKVEDRALGRGGVEELFEDQVWTNWSEIKIAEMLEAASKVIQLTDNPQVAAKHPTGLKDVDNLEIIEVQAGTKGLWQMDTYPRNLQVFDQAVKDWQAHAQMVGSAGDALLGETPSSGTPFKLYEAEQMESKSMHRYRQGQLAVFMDEIYRDWVLKHIAKEILDEQFFLSEFSADEMAKIAEMMSENEANKMITQKILNGEEIFAGEKETLIETVKNNFLKGGNKRFLQILQDEFKESSLSVMTNIAGKQKNLALLTDKVVNVLRQYISTPEIRQDPEMAKLLNTILESSGLSPIMFGASPARQIQQPQQAQAGTTIPLKELSQVNQTQTV